MLINFTKKDGTLEFVNADSGYGYLAPTGEGRFNSSGEKEIEVTSRTNGKTDWVLWSALYPFRFVDNLD